MKNKDNEIMQLPYARKMRILQEINENDFVKTEQLAKDLNVSYMTVYRDIMELERKGDVLRVHGGAKAVPNGDELPDSNSTTGDPISSVIHAYGDLTIEERFGKEVSYKKQIAAAAAAFVEDGDIIAIDPSTTTLHMCSYLMDKKIIVVTTSLSVALQFSTSQTVTVIMCGGIVRRKSLNIIGSLLPNTLQNIRIDKCFISAFAFNCENGLTDMTLEESDAKRQMINRSRKLIVLVDNTKINQEGSFMVCKLSEIDTVITDVRANKSAENLKILNECEKCGCKVIFA